MASLILQFEDQVLKAYAMTPTMTIGRLSDNAVVIDNPAVSSHHACVFLDGNDFIVEDLQSTNGTFVNDTRVIRQALRHGDVVLVGKHKLVFDEQSVADLTAGDTGAKRSSNGETILVDPKQHPRLLGIVMNAEARAKEMATAASQLGALRVVDGSADRQEYLLESHTSLIGRASWTLVRLKGWFKPGVAAAITRNHQGYVATRLRGKMLINKQAMSGRHELREGDVLSVGGLTLAFHFVEQSESSGQGSAAVARSTSLECDAKPHEHSDATA
jgi:pSer/pThr/pTyr-binding forkhead associated (FHA) protein